MSVLEAVYIIGGALVAAYFGLKLNLGPMATRKKLGLWAGFLLSLGVVFGLGGLDGLTKREMDLPHRGTPLRLEPFLPSQV